MKRGEGERLSPHREGVIKTQETAKAIQTLAEAILDEVATLVAMIKENENDTANRNRESTN